MVMFFTPLVRRDVRSNKKAEFGDPARIADHDYARPRPADALRGDRQPLPVVCL